MPFTRLFLGISLLLFLPFCTMGQEPNDILQKKISAQFEEVTYEVCFQKLKALLNIDFFYNAKNLPQDRLLTYACKETTLSKVLEEILNPIGLDYKLNNSRIFLKRAKKIKEEPRRITVHGKVRDEETKEELIGVTILFTNSKDSSFIGGVTTNQHGYFSATLIPNEYDITISSIGYQPKNQYLKLDTNVYLNFNLPIAPVQLQEVLVSAARKEEGINLKQLQVSLLDLESEVVREAPAFLGEPDVIRTLQLLPGVQSTTEGNTGFFVRGGSFDQNLTLLDGAPIYNTAHLLGLFSVFNPDVVKEAALYKGGIPANYGGRLSSVLDIQTRDGNKEKNTLTGGIGSVASRLTLEGPLGKSEDQDAKGSFIVSGRRTYLDLLFNSAPFQGITNNRLYFYDVNFKANYQPTKKDKVTLSGYFGRDRIGVQRILNNTWGNQTASLQWTHIFGNKLFANNSLIYSNFNTSSTVNLIEGLGYRARYSLRDLTLKSDWTYYKSPNFNINFGLEYIDHRYNFGTIVPTDTLSAVSEQQVEPIHAEEISSYISITHTISPKLKLYYGLRFSKLENVGPGNLFVYDTDQVISPNTSSENIIDTIFYDNKETFHEISGLEPRFSLRYLIDNQRSIKLTYNRTRQYLHQLSTANTLTPVNMWAPVNPYIPPQFADQVTFGVFRNLRNHTLEASVEGYYKVMRNQIDFKPVAELLQNQHIETEILLGRGKAYGVEFMLKKEVGKTTGWVGYTWSRSIRNIDGINNGENYPSSFDRRHDVSILFNHQVNENISFSGNWVYASGVAYTFPVGRYEKDGFIVPLFQERNAVRLPPTHRLDVSLTVKRKPSPNRKNRSSFNFSIYNIYGRRNPYAYVFRQNRNDRNRTEVVKLFLFTVLPSFTYNFKF